ncbi:MAG TPA: large conductance mechanosensitive channel protein MscL [Jatrophihabitantaceae bacterium]
MLKGFKEFIMRGNVVDLAIAVVIGTAFAAVVSSFVTAIVQPIVNAAGGSNTNGLGFSLKHTGGVPSGSPQDVLGKSTFVNFSTIINAIIVFVITALVVYFVFVLPINKYKEARAKRLAAGQPVEEPEANGEDVVLLEQIRDLLQAQQGGPAAGTPGSGAHSAD